MHYLSEIKQFLEKNGKFDQANVEKYVIQRKNGKQFSFEDHIRGLIYSLLSNQRRWDSIKPKLHLIDEIFFGYDSDKIQAHSGEYFCNELVKIKAGNRQIAAQMNALQENIKTLRLIEEKFGNIDNFITSDVPNNIVKSLSAAHKQYKLKCVGPALAWEYIRNVGIEGVKPDVHLRRFLGKARMGMSEKNIASEREVIAQAEELKKSTGYSLTVIDALIWNYCADGGVEICSETLKCGQCCCRNKCRYNSHELP